MRNGKYILIKAPKNYPGKKYRGKYCYEHHAVYWKNTGIVPDISQIIHHKDDDTRNNLFKNLELMKKREHNKYHTRKRGRMMLLIRCPICGIEFKREKRISFLGGMNTKFTTCSNKCSGKLSYIDKEKINMLDFLIKQYRDYS